MLGAGVVMFALGSNAMAQPAVHPEPPPARGGVATEVPGVVEPSQPQPLVIASGEVTPPADVPPYVPPPFDAWHDGVAVGVAFGAIWVRGIDRGYYGRVEAGGYDIQRRRGGLIAGMLMGVEGWAAPASGDRLNWGGGLPVIFYGGLQSDAAFGVLGLGFDVALVDRIEQETGVGFFAPEAAANVGLDLEGVRFLVDARASYRWQFSAPDRAAVRLGGAIQLTTD